MANIADLRAEAARIAPWLIPAVSTFSALGTTSYGIDTLLWTDPSNLGLQSGSLNNLWVYRPAAANVSDRERRLLGNSGDPLDTTNARIYADRVWTVAPASAELYELWVIQPKAGFNLLVETMENFLQADIQGLPVLTDADMQASGTTSYSVSGAGALSKVTAAANVLYGAQSLFFNAGTASEYLETPSIRVQGSQAYFAAADYRVDAGGPIYFAVWDKTNNAEIENGSRRSHSLEAFMHVSRVFNVPATCEEVALRVYVTADSDDVYISGFHGPYKASDQVLPVPTGLIRDIDLRKLFAARYGLQVSDGVSDPKSRRLVPFLQSDFHTRLNLHHATQGVIEMPERGSLPLAPIFAETMRKAADITTFVFTAAGESAPTTSLPKRLLTLEWVRRMCLHILAQPTLLNYAVDQGRVQATLDEIAPELTGLMRDYRRDLETPVRQVKHPLHGYSMSGV